MQGRKHPKADARIRGIKPTRSEKKEVLYRVIFRNLIEVPPPVVFCVPFLQNLDVSPIYIFFKFIFHFFIF